MAKKDHHLSEEEIAARKKLVAAWTDSNAQMVSAETKPKPTRKSGKPAPLPLPAGAQAAEQPAEPNEPAIAPQRVKEQEARQVKREPEAPANEVEEDTITRDRRHLAAGIAWTVIAIVWAMLVTFVNGTSGNKDASLGPGPFPVAFASITAAWIVSILSRLLGSYWYLWYLVPVLIVLLGPGYYYGYWAENVRAATRDYLPQTAAEAEIDIDVGNATTATINTPTGCFDLTRELGSNGDTVVTVMTDQPRTAREQADMSLTPSYARQVATGGDLNIHRQFIFKRGDSPPLVYTPRTQSITCL